MPPLNAGPPPQRASASRVIAAIGASDGSLVGEDRRIGLRALIYNAEPTRRRVRQAKVGALVE
jgi:hypothetical protein